MPTPVVVAGVLAFVAVVTYLLAALVAEAPRAGSPLPAPPLPAPVRRVLNTTTRKAVAGVAAVAVLVVVVSVWDSLYVPLALVLVLGVPAAYTDARELQLPDELTYTLAAVTTVTVFVLHLTGGGDGDGVLRAVLSGAGYSLALLLFALFAPAGRGRTAEAGSVRTATPAALGLGDIKLAVGLGVALGWTSVPAVTAALFLTATTHLLWLLTVTVTRRAGRSPGMAATALGPWMVLGTVAALALSLP